MSLSTSRAVATALSLAALAVTSCGPGETFVLVTVTSDSPQEIAALDVTVTRSDAAAAPTNHVTIQPTRSASVPPQTFALHVPSQSAGALRVDLVASYAGGGVPMIAMGTGTTQVVAGKTANLTVKLGKAVLVAGSATGNTFLLVTAQSDAPLSFRSLDVTVAQTGTAEHFTVTPAAGFNLPPDQVFAFRFPSDRAGTVSVDVVASDAGGRVAKGSGMAQLVAGASASVSIKLGPFALALGALGTVKAGTNPSGIASADFNGDGKADLAVANQGGGGVSVLTGRGDGSFDAVGYAVGRGPQQVAVGDFNGDAKPDIVVANYDSYDFSLLLNDGHGGFPAASINLATGMHPTAILAADFNGDGKLDVAVANDNDSEVGIYLGKGDGSFRPVTTYGVDASPIGMAVADLDGNGKLDLFVGAEFSFSPVVLLGNGDGTFQSSWAIPLSYSSGGVAAGDFDGDGKMDIAITNIDINVGAVGVLIGKGNGTDYNQVVGYGVGDIPLAVATADLNGDGRLNLIVANKGDNKLSVLLGKGDGTFKGTMDFPTGNAPVGIAVVDLNGDGKLDVALAENGSAALSDDGNVGILINTSP